MDSQAKRTSGISVTAMVLGIVALVFIWVPFFGFVSALLGIIFGGIGMSQTKKDPTLTGRGMAVAGLVCGIIAVAVWVVLIAAIGVLGIFSTSTTF